LEKLGLAEYEVKMHDLGVEHLSDIQVSEVENSNSAMQN
jgi:hypothetical protein